MRTPAPVHFTCGIMERCLVCSGRAVYREKSHEGLRFCTHLCQRAWHGIGRRSLSRQDPLPREHEFFDVPRPRLWWKNKGLFPTNAQVFEQLRNARSWPSLEDISPRILLPKGESAFEIGGSEAELSLAVYSNPERDVPFLPTDTVMVLKTPQLYFPQTIPGPGDNRIETLRYRERAMFDDIAINEACTGIRVAALFFAGISRAFVPIIDFFPCACNAELSEISPERRFFTVQPVVENSMHIWEGLPAEADLAVPYVRSVFAQVLAAIEAAQHHIEFTHYDLNVGNVLVEQTDIVGGEVWTCTRHTYSPLHFDPRDTQGKLVRIIDYGLSRAEDPHGMMAETYWKGRSTSDDENIYRGFDAHRDTRMVAYFLIEHIATQRRELADVLFKEDDLMRVLKMMLGLDSWTSLHSPTGEYTIFLKKDSRILRRSVDKTIHLALPFDAADLLRFAMDIGGRVSGFYWAEVNLNRKDDSDAPTPSNILDDKFFDSMRLPLGEGTRTIIDIGDSTREIPPGIPPELCTITGRV